MRHLENIRQIPSGWLSRISKGSQSPPLPLSNRHSLSSVCVRRGSVLFPCCFSCIKVAWPRVYRRTCLPLFRVAADRESIPGKETTRKKNYQGCSNPVPRLLRVSGTWLGLDTRGNYSQKRWNAIKRDVLFRGRPGTVADFLSRTDLPLPLSIDLSATQFVES